MAIDLATVSHEDGGENEYYQIPLAFYPEPQERLSHALVGEWDDETSVTPVYDREA